MALTDFQRRLCRLLADNRIGAGESYVAGGAALNELIAGPRISRDIVNVLPADEVGTCVLTRRAEDFRRMINADSRKLTRVSRMRRRMMTRSCFSTT